MGYESVEYDSLLTLGVVLKIFVNAVKESKVQDETAKGYLERAENELKKVQAEVAKYGLNGNKKTKIKKKNESIF